jgi:RNA polymerase sigma-70 factor (ECF subfamily)
MNETQQVSFPEPSATRSGFDAEELRILYRRAIASIACDFEETTWKAFQMVVIDDHSPAETAAALGLTTHAVYLAKARVLTRLRDEFGGLIDP